MSDVSDVNKEIIKALEDFADGLESGEVRGMVSRAALPPRRCRKCNGNGVDPDSRHRWTSGGHDDQQCPRCFGSGEEPL